MYVALYMWLQVPFQVRSPRFHEIRLIENCEMSPMSAEIKLSSSSRAIWAFNHLNFQIIIFLMIEMLLGWCCFLIFISLMTSGVNFSHICWLFIFHLLKTYYLLSAFFSFLYYLYILDINLVSSIASKYFPPLCWLSLYWINWLLFWWWNQNHELPFFFPVIGILFRKSFLYIYIYFGFLVTVFLLIVSEFQVPHSCLWST